ELPAKAVSSTTSWVTLQRPPPAMRILAPSRGLPSKTTMRRPGAVRAAQMAAINPAAPPPITATSTRSSGRSIAPFCPIAGGVGSGGVGPGRQQVTRGTGAGRRARMAGAGRRKPQGRRRTSSSPAALSFRRFVDDALFHPAWGYYATGQVRFGEGGHYDTYPLGLSSAFGRMLAAYVERVWKRWGRPGRIELCEVGAGNGQLCLDVLAAVERRGGRGGWEFAAALRYRIVERSPALVARQRATLGPL